MDISSVWLILLILDVRWIVPLKSLSASSVLSNNLAPQPSVGGAWSLVVCTAGMFLHFQLSLGVDQLIASETKRGCSRGIVHRRSCSELSARGAVCQVWPPPPSAALPLISAGFALVACPSWGVLACPIKPVLGWAATHCFHCLKYFWIGGKNQQDHYNTICLRPQVLQGGPK